MARLAPKLGVLRALFAKSGNLCAFPGCTHHLINQKNQFVGQICHIEAALEGGERYNKNMTDEDRRSYENLLMLCYAHHVETNDIDTYTVSKLKKIKSEHENNSKLALFKIDESNLHKILDESEKYWDKIEKLNNEQHRHQDMAITVDHLASFGDVTEDLNKLFGIVETFFSDFDRSDNRLLIDLKKIFEDLQLDFNLISNIPYYDNPFENRNWEKHNIGVPNISSKIRMLLVQLEIKYLDEYLKTNNDQASKEKYVELKEKFEILASSSTYID